MMSKYPSFAGCEPPQWSSPRYLRRVGAIVLMAAIAATLLFIWIGRTVDLREISITFWTSIIHSAAIGLPCALVLPRVGIALGKRSRSARITGILVAIFFLTTFGCLAANLVIVALKFQRPEDLWTHFMFSWRISIVIAMAFGLGSYLYESLRSELEKTQLQLRTQEVEQERTRKLAAEARLSSLESRIHPHFLFNTLNSISSLIPDDPKRAEDMVGKLAALLRFSLDAHQRPLVPLEQEMKVVRDYLEIEKARFADRLRYTIDVAPGTESAEVPPLAIQTLVENSIKHVVAPRREGGDIAITVRKGSGGLEISVADSGPGFSLDAAAPGHGLDNVQSRLGVLFGSAALLAAGRENGRAAVRIAVPSSDV